MTRPVIFSVAATWDDEAGVWTGACGQLPAAADAPTLDGLVARFAAMALDLVPDNHPRADPASVFIQITALRAADVASERAGACSGIAPSSADALA